MTHAVPLRRKTYNHTVGISTKDIHFFVGQSVRRDIHFFVGQRKYKPKHPQQNGPHRFHSQSHNLIAVIQINYFPINIPQVLLAVLILLVLLLSIRISIIFKTDDFNLWHPSFWREGIQTKTR